MPFVFVCVILNLSFSSYNNNRKMANNNPDRYRYRNSNYCSSSINTPVNGERRATSSAFVATNSSSMQTSEIFDYICVIDFEATCIEDRNLNFPHEIIEFPVVLINMKTMTIEDTFQQYVRPVINTKLSKYCRDLTGITQEQVDKAETFPDVLKKVNEWFQKKKLSIATSNLLLRPWDFQKFLNLQCYYSNILYPFWASRWIDVRQMFADWFGVYRCGIVQMLNRFGFTFTGTEHCGLDDSRNIARIFMKLIEIGCPIIWNGNIQNCMSYIEKLPYLTAFNGFLTS